MGATQPTEIGWRSSAGVGDFIPCIVSSEYTTKYSLNMFPNIGTQQIASWVDMGSEYDTITTKFDIELSDDANYLAFEDQLKNKSGAVNQSEVFTPVIRFADGFNPLTPLYENCTKSAEVESSGYYELSFPPTDLPKQLNINNDAVQYEMSVFPNGEDLSFASAFESCRVFNDWTLDGLGLPYPSSNVAPKLNANTMSKQLNKGSSNQSRYGLQYGETLKLTLNLDEERTRLLMEKIRSVRGSQFDIVIPLNFNFFTHLYPTNTTFKCILNKKDIVVKTNGHKDIDVSFTIQLVSVVS